MADEDAFASNSGPALKILLPRHSFLPSFLLRALLLAHCLSPLAIALALALATFPVDLSMLSPLPPLRRTLAKPKHVLYLTKNRLPCNPMCQPTTHGELRCSVGTLFAQLWISAVSFDRV